MTAVAEVRDLRVRFTGRGGPVEALRGVTLGIAPGEILALVGGSGSGKSVLARTLLGLHAAGAAEVTGDAAVAGVDMVRGPAADRTTVQRSLVGAVFQDPLTSLDPTMRIGPQVMERDRDRDRAVRALTDCGVPEPEERLRQWPHQLSGGLRQRVSIAGAVTASPSASAGRLAAVVRERAGQPLLLVADEPTTALDVRVQARVVELFARLRAEHGTAVLLITHDLGLAAQIADRIAVMHAGELCEIGSTDDVLDAPRHEVTRRLLADRIDVADRVPPRAEPPADGPALDLRGLTKRFRSPSGAPFTALDDVSLSVRAGGSLALVGESGSGKSTLLRIAAGLERPDSGVVDRAAGGTQLVFQDAGASLTPWFSIGRQIGERLRVRGVGREEAAERTAALLGRVGLEPAAAGRRPAALSGGQRQRAAIARALASDPAVLLCDEPVSALDASLAARTLDLLHELQEAAGFALVLVTHDLAVAKRLGVDLAVMHRGRIVEQGRLEAVFEDPQHEYTRDLLAASPSLAGRTAREA